MERVERYDSAGQNLLNREVAIIGIVTTATISNVMTMNRGKHPAGSWMDVSPAEHIRAAARHIMRWMNGVHESDGEYHLDNALCRLAMAATVNLIDPVLATLVKDQIEGEYEDEFDDGT